MASSIRAFVARRPRETAPLASADSGRARDRRGRGGAPRALGGALFADIRKSRRAPAPAGVARWWQRPASAWDRSPRARSAVALDLGRADLAAHRAGRHRARRRGGLADR